MIIGIDTYNTPNCPSCQKELDLLEDWKENEGSSEFKIICDYGEKLEISSYSEVSFSVYKLNSGANIK